MTKKTNNTKKQNNSFNFPADPAAFNKWFATFARTVKNNNKSFGFQTTNVRQLNTAFSSWMRAYKAMQKAQAAQTKAAANMATSRTSLISIFNSFNGQISKNSANKGQFAQFGIAGMPAPAKTSKTSKTSSTSSKKSATSTRNSKSTTKPATSKVTASKSVKPVVKKTTKPVVKSTAKPVAKKAPVRNSTSVPSIKIDSSVRGKVMINVQPNGNGKWPANSNGAIIQFRQKGGTWQNLSTTNEFPFTHIVGKGKNNGPFEYRAAWNFNGKNGTWSRSTTVTLKAA